MILSVSTVKMIQTIKHTDLETFKKLEVKELKICSYRIVQLILLDCFWKK